MKLVLTTVPGDDAEINDAHIAFHLHAGVDLILVASGAGAQSYQQDDRVQLVHVGAEQRENEIRTRMAQEAAALGADWVIDSDSREFWWPRGEDLKEVLAPIPERYTIVQGLRREFSGAGAGFFAERMTLRPSLEHMPPDGETAPVLRPVFRADPEVVVRADGIELRRSVPLRAWYPIEVLYFPSEPRAAPSSEPELVEDTRLRDALRAVRGGGTPLTFRTPDIVDDARYAVECAAVGEVDLPRLEQYVTELERRIEWLEQRFWPRVLRRVARIAGRSS